ncbi:MAG TPA: ABC transporter permease [Blastocatellia bacterium]|nr:ABC transporter permease [Blastocatellia bacterium]
MRRLRALVLRFLYLFNKERRERDLAEEIESHLQMHIADNVRAGLDPSTARRQALIRLGGVAATKQQYRERGGFPLIDNVGRDLRYALRMLGKNPGFAAVAVLTLAICLGTTLTIFAVMDAIVLRPLPFPESEQLVTMFNTYPRAGVERDGSSLTNYYERRGKIAAFSSLSIFRYSKAIVGEPGSTVQQDVVRVSPEFFNTLGVNLALGRGFKDEEMTYQTDGVTVLTDEYWRQNFNADPAVLGSVVRVDGLSKIVVGVLPAGFRFLSSKARLYLPLSSDLATRTPPYRHSGNGNDIIARLKPGISIAESQSQIDSQNDALAGSFSQAQLVADAGFHTIVVPLHGDYVKSVRPVLLLLQAGALVLLLIGLVNLVNLLLIRASSRAKELVIRESLGASAGHIMAAVMTETELLAAIGGVAGLAFAGVGIRLLTVFDIDQLPLGANVAFDGRLALVALFGSLLVGLFVAVPVVWFNLRGGLTHGLQSATRGGTVSRGAQRLRHGFIVAQMTLAFILLAGAGLLGLSLERAMAAPPGFRTDHALTGQISLPWIGYKDTPARVNFTDRLREQVAGLPGVSAVGISTRIPLNGDRELSAATPKGYAPLAGQSIHSIYSYGVTGDYFAAMGIPLLKGRYLNAGDSRTEARPCVVDEDFARRYWPEGNAIGQQVFDSAEAGPDATAFTVVGVVGAVKQGEVTDNQAQGAVYYPFRERADLSFFVVVRTSQAPELLRLTLANAVRSVDPDLPVSDLQSMDGRLDGSLVARRSPALLVAIFACAALLLAAIGTYGVLSYAVAERRREIGLRMALGAMPAQIRNQFLGLGFRLLGIGTVLGVAGAALTGKLMQSLLFDVPALHAATLFGATGVMTAVALIAFLLPVSRASRVDPNVVLRCE